MKIVKIQNGWWDIIQDGKTIASIQTFWRYGKADGKMLYIEDKKLGEVKNQREAIEKLKEHLKNK